MMKWHLPSFQPQCGWFPFSVLTAIWRRLPTTNNMRRTKYMRKKRELRQSLNWPIVKDPASKSRLPWIVETPGCGVLSGTKFWDFKTIKNSFLVGTDCGRSQSVSLCQSKRSVSHWPGSVVSCKIFVPLELRYLNEMLWYGDMHRGEISNYKIQVKLKISVGLQTEH